MNTESKKAKTPILPLSIIMMIITLLGSLNKAHKDKVPPFPTEIPTVAKAEEVSKSKAIKSNFDSSKESKITAITI